MAHLPHGLPGANVPGVPLVCPRAQARPRDKAVACEPEGTGGPSLPPSGCPCPHPSLAPHSALAWSPRGGRHCGVRSGHSRSSFAWRSPHPLPASPTPASHSVCQGPLLLAPGPTSTGEACQLLQLHPMAPNKLAICCCLSNTFVMQIKEPAPVPCSEEEVGCFCLFLLFLSLCGCNC